MAPARLRHVHVNSLFGAPPWAVALRYHRGMSGCSRRFSRRSLLASSFLAARALASDIKTQKGEVFESEWDRYSDAATEFPVYRLTQPSYTSTLPAAYNRLISRNSGTLLYCCDRNGSPQAFRMNLKSGEAQQLTDRKGVDGASLMLLPDSRSFCYFAERALYLVNLANLKALLAKDIA